MKRLHIRINETPTGAEWSLTVRKPDGSTDRQRGVELSTFTAALVANAKALKACAGDLPPVFRDTVEVGR